MVDGDHCIKGSIDREHCIKLTGMVDRENCIKLTGLPATNL